MARHSRNHLAPGGTAILSGLLRTQARGVMAAHRRCGLRLEAVIAAKAPWTTLVVRRPHALCRARRDQGGGAQS